MGATDIFYLSGDKDNSELLTELLSLLNLKWRTLRHSLKQKTKIFQATVVTINHEINQPLTVIMNAIGLLKVELKDIMSKDKKINSHLNFISKTRIVFQKFFVFYKYNSHYDLIWEVVTFGFSL